MAVTDGSYTWKTVSKPLPSGVCGRMCKRTRLIDWIILGGTASTKHIQRETAWPDGHTIDLTKHNRVHGDLLRSIEVVSDCLGALK